MDSADSGSPHLLKQTDFPLVQLRGYGKISGSLATSSDLAPVSLLTIHCESDAKAKIVQAKYLSDFGLLPGVTSVTLQTKRGEITAKQADSQGDVAAVRSGTDVYILAAPTSASIVSLAEENLPKEAKIDSSDLSETDGHVPMYLDRWDKWGMRFYYGPFTTPKHGINDFQSTYDPMDDFHFADDSGKCGLVLWETPFPTESAYGILKTPMWDWTVSQSEKMGLPIGVNLSTGVPCSLFNRYRDQWTMRQPDYLGGFYGLLDTDEGIFSWNSISGRDAQFAVLQQTVRRFNNVDNVVNWLNPDGEMGHDAPDNLIDYGPVADTGYRKFLKERYKTTEAVSKRWYGDATKVTSWDNVHVPELASFLGWGKDAIDLTGIWKVSREAAAGPETANPAFDDSKWAPMSAPGHAIGILLPRSPAVLRRHITIDPAWRAAHPVAYLYVFDLSDTRNPQNPQTRTFLNGKELTEAEPSQPHTQAHWAAYDASTVMTTGDNVVTVDVPQGFFNYRVYFSPQAPVAYPDMGPQLNAQWADFIDWGSWSRANAVRRGAQMIRQADPNRPITFMSPDSYANDIKSVCEDYGGVFHNTGYMAGVWADFHSMEMTSADLPTDCEPGSGARDVPDFMRFMGRWSTEGIQGVDYFQHIGDVEWNEGIKNYFHDTLNLWHLIGKYHVPKAEVALLSSDRIDRLYGFPFHPDKNPSFRHGHWDVRFNELLLPEYPRDEVFEQDFDRGHTDAYKVIIDSNTSVMDDEFVSKIEKWVRAGGIFVTWGQTGRNTSTEKDSWPISKLTGFKVQTIEAKPRRLHVDETQTIVPNVLSGRLGTIPGLTLEKQLPECVDLLQWDDGSTAIGMRPVGNGYVIQVGPQMGRNEALSLFKGILNWAKVVPIPATAPNVTMRHFVSNNGLYDVWAMWNGTKDPVQTTLTFRGGLHPKSAVDVKTGKTVAIQNSADGPSIPISLNTWETQVLLTPRDQIASAPADWFKLQRNWWRGSGDLGPEIPPFKSKLTLDLQPDWKFKVLDGVTDGTQGKALSGAHVDDSSWEKRYFGVFNIPDHPDAKHGMFRKRFTVPDDWRGGRIDLWLSEWHGTGYIQRGVTFLDGKLLGDRPAMGLDITKDLKPGTTHTLSAEIWSEYPVAGTPTSVWLEYIPKSDEEQDLAGKWSPAEDGLNYTEPVAIPGPYKGAALRQNVKISAAHEKQNVVVRVSADNYSIYGVIINGTWISRFHHHLGNWFDIAITPYVKFGADNEIILFGGPNKRTVKQVSLEYYTKGTYP